MAGQMVGAPVEQAWHSLMTPSLNTCSVLAEAITRTFKCGFGLNPYECIVYCPVYNVPVLPHVLYVLPCVLPPPPRCAVQPELGGAGAPAVWAHAQWPPTQVNGGAALLKVLARLAVPAQMLAWCLLEPLLVSYLSIHLSTRGSHIGQVVAGSCARAGMFLFFLEHWRAVRAINR